MNKIPLNIKEYQNILLNILLDFDKICKKLNINYYLISGTLLGAIRHKGFIPWDDDIDVAMLRADFQKLKNYLNENNSKYELYDSCPQSCTYPYLIRFIDTSMKVSFLNTISSPWIDIFYLDKCPSKIVENQTNKIKLLLKLRNFSKQSLLIRKDFSLFPYAKKLLQINRFIPFTVFFNLNKIDNKLKKLYEENNNTTDDNYDLIYYYRHFNKEVFKPMEIEFEGHLFKSLNGYDEYLKSLYGDYMQLPPKEKQIPGHDLYLIKE